MIDAVLIGLHHMHLGSPKRKDEISFYILFIIFIYTDMLLM